MRTGGFDPHYRQGKIHRCFMLRRSRHPHFGLKGFSLPQEVGTTVFALVFCQHLVNLFVLWQVLFVAFSFIDNV